MICPTPEIDAPLELYSNYSRTKRDTSLQEEGGDEYFSEYYNGQTLVRSKREVVIPPDEQFHIGLRMDAVPDYVDLTVSPIKEQAYIDIIPTLPTIEPWESVKQASEGVITIKVWIGNTVDCSKCRSSMTLGCTK